MLSHPAFVGSVSADGLVACGIGNAQCVAVGSVVHLGDLGSELDGHLSDVGLALQDLGCHLAGGSAQIVVVDGQGCDAAAGADAKLATIRLYCEYSSD